MVMSNVFDGMFISLFFIYLFFFLVQESFTDPTNKIMKTSKEKITNKIC